MEGTIVIEGQYIFEVWLIFHCPSSCEGIGGSMQEIGLEFKN